MREMFFRGARFLRALYPRVPRWAQYGIVFALLPIPGPFDEVIGALVVTLLWVRHRDLVRETWEETRDA